MSITGTDPNPHPMFLAEHGLLYVEKTGNLTAVHEEVWEQFQELLGTSKFWKIRNGLISKYLKLCWPMMRKDLVQELDMAVLLALLKYRRKHVTYDRKNQALRTTQLSTWLYAVMQNRLIDLARQQDEDVSFVPLVVDCEEGMSNEPSHEDDLAELIDLRDALGSVKDADLLLLRAAGVRDSEIASGVNLCTRRHRAMKRLAELMSAPRAA